MTCSDCKGKGYIELFYSCSPCSCQKRKSEEFCDTDRFFVFELSSGNECTIDFEMAYQTLFVLLSGTVGKADNLIRTVDNCLGLTDSMTMKDRNLVREQFLKWKEEKEKEE